MNIKSLYHNINEIEKTIKAFSENQLTYSSARDTLIGYGYSVKEAEKILENLSGQ